MKRRWTNEENEILERGCMENKTSKEISLLLHDRSAIAVEKHISSLGLNKKYYRGKLNDLTGKVFGNWKVLKRIEDYITPSGYQHTQYLCECQCKNKTVKPQISSNLISGKTKSCGCLLGEHISNSLRSSNTYDLSGEYGIGYMDNGGEFYFDLEDYDLIKNYKWHIDKAGYIVACIKDGDKQTTIKMHRLVMGVSDPKIQIDHIKHRVNDNRKSKLRVATQTENSMNKRLLDNNTSGKTGVYFNKRDKKWIAQIACQNKLRVLGRFENYDDAVSARIDAENKLFGEFSYLNSMRS